MGVWIVTGYYNVIVFPPFILSYRDHPLAALSHVENMSIVSSFNMAGDAFSDCAMGERTR